MQLVKLFREFQTIFGVCPCCGEVFRLSEARLYVGRPPRRTVFDELHEEQRKVDQARERFEARESRIREVAKLKGQAVARRLLRRMAPVFVSNHIDPNDVKVVFDPVEYVVFKGLTNGGCSRIRFLDRPSRSVRQERIQNSLAKTIDRGDIFWRTYRISETGNITVES
jgi:predicted Holliday junction resolvase-like endonuclease